MGSGDLADYYNKAKLAMPGSAQPAETAATFLAVGDIMLSRNVAGTSLKAGDPLLAYKSAAGLLGSTDFNFANLESPLSGSDRFNPTGSLVFNAVPKLAAGLNQYNFKIVNLANNHALDQGEAGLKYTLDFLDKAGVKHEGTGANLDAAWTPAIVEDQGIKIAFIGASYSSVNDGGQASNNFVARIEDLVRLKKAVAAARGMSDFVVVSMHAGTEYTRTPNSGQTAFAHAAIDAGADIVIGAHPHWVQTIEQYNGKYIFYSLGNFIFDQMFSQDTREGLALKVTVSKPGVAGAVQIQGTPAAASLKQIELVPLIIDNYCCPRPANEVEAKRILGKIEEQQTIIR